jgi:hypothetical protein
MVEKIKSHIVYLVKFFFENRAVDNVGKYIQPERPQMTIQRIRFSFWITKATNTHSAQANAPQYYVIPTLSVLFDS